MNTLLRCKLQCFADLSLLLRSCRCIIWLQLSTSNKIMTSRASFGTALPTVALQTIVAPASSQGSSPYLYNLIGTTSQKGSPLQQLQCVWAECPPMPSNGSTATVDSPALQTFSLSSCRAKPNQCNLTAAAAAATGGICSTRPVPELWAQSAYAYELCAAAGLGDTVDFVNCIGVQSSASYNASINDEAAQYSGTYSSQYSYIYSECTNLACRRAQPGCVSDADAGKLCWGTVVQLDPSYPTPAAAKAYIGYPCLETQPALVPKPRLAHSMHSTLPPDQQALYADGTWQACDCAAPAGTEPQVDAAIRNTARDLYWTEKCGSGSVDLLPSPVRQRWCSPGGSKYGAWQRAGPLNIGMPAVRQLQIKLQILRKLREFLTSPDYASSPLKDFADSWRELRDKVDDALAWCKIGQAAIIPLLPLVLVFPPLAIGLFMSFDSC